MHAVSRRTIMLVLSRHENEAIVIDGHIKITVVEIRGNKIRLGIEAPKDIAVWREELVVASPNQLEMAVA
jgi:carbon storage regulator